MGNTKRRRERDRLARRAKHERLLRLFDGDGYEVFETPKYIFVKQKNNNNDTWEVAIYTRESWEKKERAIKARPEYSQANIIENLKQIV